MDGALAALGILFFVTDLGFPMAHTKRVSEGADPGDCLATFTVFKLVATAAFALVTTLIVVYATFINPAQFQDYSPVVLIFVGAYLAAKSFAGIPQANFDARLEAARSQLVTFTESMTRIAFTILFAWLYAAVVSRDGPLAGLVSSAPGFVGEWLVRHPAESLAIAYMLGGVASAFAAFRYVRTARDFGRFRWDILKSYWQFALPLFIVGTVGVVGAKIDAVALTLFGSDVNTGTFTGLRRITLFVETLPVAVALMLFPTVSALAAAGDKQGAVDTTRRALRYTSMVVFPAVVFVIVFAKPIISLVLSNAWLDEAIVLQVLAIYSLLFAMSRPLSALLTGINRPDVAARAAIAMSVTLIVFNLLLIPSDIKSLNIQLFGLYALGAAISTALSGLVGYILYFYASSRLAGLHHPPEILKHLVAALGMAAALWLLAESVVGLERWYHLLFFGMIGGAVYLALLWVLKEFRDEEFRFFLNLAHPGQMLRYVRGELKR